MNRLCIIVPTAISVLIYVLLSSLFGQSGVLSYKQLELQKMNLSAHIESIEQINDELNIKKMGLFQDPDVLRAYAKKIGYVSDGEILVKITGMEINPDKPYNVGTYLKLKKITYISEKTIKLISLLVGIFLNALSLSLSYTKKSVNKSDIEVSLQYGDSKGF